METNLSNVVEITSKVAKYDASVKEVLADKQVLSRILKYSLGQFTRNYTQTTKRGLLTTNKG